jgi:integrase
VRGPQQRSWLFRYMIQGRARSMGLGHADVVSLVEARNKADAARRLVRDGVDPLDARAVAQAKAITFSAAADRFITAHQSGWTAQHAAVWRATLAADVEPVIGALPVEAIDTAAVLRVLTPIWQTKNQTATRLRGRIEKVLSFAIVQGWRVGPNPAVWRGHLQLTLPASRKVRPIQHFAALDWREAQAFMAKLCEQDSMGALALRFAILTATRSGEVRGATWEEIDLERAVWTIPGSRMKARKEHRVPLSAPALGLLRSVALLRTDSGPVFPGQLLRRLPEIRRRLAVLAASLQVPITIATAARMSAMEADGSNAFRRMAKSSGLSPWRRAKPFLALRYHCPRSMK